MKKILFGAFLLLFISSCLDDEKVLKVDGLKPVYLPLEQAKIVELQSPRAIIEPGKIVYKAPYIYLIEKYQGVHIIDDSDPANPSNVLFISIPGNVDIAVKGDVLFADNYLDLISIDISSFESISVIDRKENVFPNKGQASPDDYDGYFECADPAKGPVIGWEEAVLIDPKCQK